MHRCSKVPINISPDVLKWCIYILTDRQNKIFRGGSFWSEVGGTENQVINLYWPYKSCTGDWASKWLSKLLLTYTSCTDTCYQMLCVYMMYIGSRCKWFNNSNHYLMVELNVLSFSSRKYTIILQETYFLSLRQMCQDIGDCLFPTTRIGVRGSPRGISVPNATHHLFHRGVHATQRGKFGRGLQTKDWQVSTFCQLSPKSKWVILQSHSRTYGRNTSSSFCLRLSLLLLSVHRRDIRVFGLRSPQWYQQSFETREAL